MRAELEADLAARGAAALHADLAAADPAAAAGIYVQDERRIVRALEVVRLTGRRFSEFRPADEPRPRDQRPESCVWLDPPRAARWGRIHRRVDAMFAGGLVEEVRTLAARPGGLGRTARQGLGYKEVFDHLERGVPLVECTETLKTRTRQFSKRQCTSFRGLPECVRVPLTGDESAGLVAEIVAAFLPGSA